jgi:serine/threonine-protein kinase
VEAISAGRRPPTIEPAPSQRLARFVLPALLWAAFATALAVWALIQPPPRPPVTRWTIHLPADQRLSTAYFERSLAISPDGRRIAYTAESGGETQLFMRPVDEFSARPVPGTEGARSPFFSPDGEWVAFFVANDLFRISVSGGAPLAVCDVPVLAGGGTWTPGDTIYFFSVELGLFRVPATGGERELALQAGDQTIGAAYRGWPIVLPNGAVVATAGTRDGLRATVLSPGAADWRLIEGLGEAAPIQYLSDGYLLYVQAGAVRAVPLDIDRVEPTGPSFSLLDSVAISTDGSTAHLAVSHTGTMVYVRERGAARTLVWVDRSGHTTPLGIEHANFLWPRVSPDGRRLVVNIERAGLVELWVYDIARGTRRQLPGANTTDPIWYPDGTAITYGLFGPDRSRTNLAQTLADGTGAPDTLLPAHMTQAPHSWSPDGTRLAYYEIDPTTTRDIILLSEDGTSTPYLNTPANERSPVFSPDGRWIAYTSDESGRDEVYLAPSEEPRPRRQVSTGGGWAPVWSRDGRELFYRNRAAVMAVQIRTMPTVEIGTPELLFEGPFEPDPAPSGSVNYDVAPDGRFLMVQSTPLTDIRVVLNWFEELQQRAQQ